MKKGIFLFLFASLFSFCCNAQNIIQISNDGNRNNNNNQQQECEFKINGICSTEDIGGVDFEKKNGDYLATNYNPSPVTVLVKVTYECNSWEGVVEHVVTKVLQPNESKYLNVPADCRYCNIQSITRKLK